MLLRSRSINTLRQHLSLCPPRQCLARPFHSFSSRIRRFNRAYFAAPVTALVIATSLGAGNWYPTPTRVCAESDNSSSWPYSAPVVIHRGQRRDFHNGHQNEHGLERSGEQAPQPQTTIAEAEQKANNTATQAGSKRWWSDLTAQMTTWSDSLTELIVPEWVQLLPGFVAKLQRELSMAPGSLAEEIWYEANDPESNPEIVWEAKVRVSEDLCHDEKLFLRKRLLHTRKALAKYLDIPEDDIHWDDVPNIAMCGSGGGLRALVAGSSSYLSSKEAGLFDCVTYTAGVSGSCWLQSLFYSSLTGQNHERLIHHLKNRLGVHIAFPPAALNLLNSAPTNKYLLSGIVEKLKGIPDADLGIVDIYGLLLAGRLLVPKGELGVNESDLKISNQRVYVDNGENPLPIYSAVRHEIPFGDETTSEAAKEKAKKEAWFQWFEFTPYEFWCEELSAGIPTWAVGRKFHNGQNEWRSNGLALPELRMPLMLGIWGSAFCATLSHYYHEIQPLLKGLAGFEGINQLVAEREDDLIKVHPIDPATIPNFALGMEKQLPASVPASFFEHKRLQLMDSGMSNNLPIYPLLRPGRDVDILIAFDASADQKADNWLKVADGYARQRGIKGWPVGCGWPTPNESSDQATAEYKAAEAHSEEEAAQKLQQAKRDQAVEEKRQQRKTQPKDLGFCNVWVGTTEERISNEEPPSSKVVEEDWELMQPNAGITVVYFPLLPNPKVEGVDPATSDFMSTWNFIYTPEQIEKVVALARANFDEGAERTRRTVRAVYERKKQQRLEREYKEKEARRRRRVREAALGKHGHGDVGDHFS